MTRLTRFPVVLLFLASSAGCAALRPQPGSVRREPGAEAAAHALAQARNEYFRGVRSFVRGEFPEAQAHLLHCRGGLEKLSEARSLNPAASREVEILLGKAEYFLDRIEETRAAPALAAPSPPPPGAPPAVAGAPWEVTVGRIEPVRNRDVERWVRYFLGEGRSVFSHWLNRRSRYLPLFREAFARYGLPPELVYHSMIESGFSVRAYSWAHAVGLWQFIRSTGRKYGLRCDWWVDERRDPRKSTAAAARYLRDLYREFRDWELALAAYNVGEAKIRRQIRRQKTRSFWRLRLPRETRNHVAKFYAAVILGSEPERYGFEVSSPPPPAAETLRVDFSVDFEVLGECCGVSPRALAELNPALIRHCTPPDEDGYPVRVPAGTAARAREALASLPPEKRVRWAHHRVRRGETLSHIARRYHSSVRAIAEANGLRSAHFLSIGQDLLIPQGRTSALSPPRLARGGRGSSRPSGTEKVVYVVRRGDTLSEIAERYGTSARMLRRWNRVGRYIRPGQRLTIYARRGGGSGNVVVKVRRGDTLWDIARVHGVSLSALLRANNLKRTDLIRPGDRIKVPPRS